MEIPTTIDVVQKYGKVLEVPEIRVWCHPHEIEKIGDDYYEVFSSFQEAIDFIKEHKEAEPIPLIAFRGREINIFEIKKPKQKEEK